MPSYFDFDLDDYSLYIKYNSINMFGKYCDYIDDYYCDNFKMKKMKNTFNPEEVIIKTKLDLRNICDRLNDNDLLIFINYCNDNNIDISKNDSYILRWAAHYNKPEIVNLLLNNKYIDPTSDNYYAIIKSISFNNNDVVFKMLNNENVDISYNNNHLLETSISYQNHGITNYILNHPKFDINIGIDNIIRVCALKGQTTILEKILENDRLSLKRSLSNGLITSIRHRKLNITYLLLTSKYIDISHDSNSAVKYALDLGLHNICELLINDERFRPSENGYNIFKYFYKNDEYLNKILKHKNILNGNINDLINIFFSKDIIKKDIIKKFIIINNNIINLIDKNVKNKLIENKLIPYYKGKVSERTL